MAGGERLRIGIAGCGMAARIHMDRLLAQPEVTVVGCADSERSRAEALAGRASEGQGAGVPAFEDHRDLLREGKPDALCIFTPHLWHYRAAMDALQAGCHVFIEKPLSTNPQEAADIVGLARGRSLKVAVGHQYRLRPSLAAARRLIRDGAIGPLRLVTATMALPWVAATRAEAENSWRFDPKVSGGGVLPDAGDHLLDALLWTTGQAAVEVCAIQGKLDPGFDVVTAAAIRLEGGTPASLAVSGITPGFLFELNFLGEQGRIRATERAVEREHATGGALESIAVPEPSQSIDGNFVAAVLRDEPLCCPAEQALDTVRLIEAVGRSAATNQLVRVV